MKAGHVLDGLELLVDGLLSEEEEQPIRAHLALCPGCRDSYQAAVLIQTRLSPDADPVPPAALLPSVLTRVARRRRRGAGTVLLAAAIGAAATVSLVLTALAGPAGLSSLIPPGMIGEVQVVTGPEPPRHDVGAGPAIAQIPVPRPAAPPTTATDPTAGQAQLEDAASPAPAIQSSASPSPSPSPSPLPSPTPSPSPLPAPCAVSSPAAGTATTADGKTGVLLPASDCLSPVPIQKPR